MSAANTLVRLWGAWACLTALSAPAFAQQGPCRVVTPTLQQSYQGDCLYGMAHGQGLAQGTDRYQGQFKEGQPHGNGVYAFGDGRRFEGEFVGGKVNGRARFHYTNGEVLEGEFRENRLFGMGRMQRAGVWVSVQLTSDGRLQALDAPPAPTQAGHSDPLTPSPAGANPAATVQAQWEAQLDFQDIFPAYLFATATRKQPENKPQSRGVTLPPVPASASAASAQSRHVSMHNSSVQYLGDAWGLVGVRYRSKTPNERVRVVVTMDEYAEPTEAEFQLGAVGDYALYPKLRYRYDRLREVAQSRPMNVRWQLFVNGQYAGHREHTAQMRALQDAPWLLRGVRGDEDMSWVFAAFVTEEAPWIDEFLRQAFADAPLGPIGYQGKPDLVDAQVKTVYNHLQKMGVKYSSITTTAGTSARLASQTVRLPSQSVRATQANCVDGAVLFASILRRMGLNTFLLVGPGHALMGYTASPDPNKPSIRVIETTTVGVAPFEVSLKKGEQKFEEWLRLKEAGNREVQILPIGALRQQGVMPIPL